jgi:NAD(P)-dependent dehydrogenase (short-subunit alcohol dehydrogenase family)
VKSHGIQLIYPAARLAHRGRTLRREPERPNSSVLSFNNARIEGTLTPTHECTDENWDRIITTNLKGVWLCMRYELNQMLKQGGGVIVNTASVLGPVGSPACRPTPPASLRRMIADSGGVGWTACEALKSPLLYQLNYRV